MIAVECSNWWSWYLALCNSLECLFAFIHTLSLCKDGDETHDWCAAFEGVRFSDGSRVNVIQASWMEVDITVYSDSGLPLLFLR